MKRKSQLQSVRQLLFPAEFRISATGYPADVRGPLTQAIEHFLKHWPPPVPPPQAAPQEDTRQLSFLADVGTGLWRMRRNMVTGSSPLMDARPIEGMGKPFRWLVSVWDVLKENGLEIQDHTGDLYKSGQTLDDAAHEPVPGLKEPTVIDTIKPSIYLRGKMIQMGVVVVGTPEAPSPGSTRQASRPDQTKGPQPGVSRSGS